MTATRRRYSPTIIILFVFSLLPSSLGADDATNGTNVIQSQLNAAKQQQMAAQKQFTLKKAAVDVAKKRVAELQQQLKKFQQKVAEETKAFEAAEKNQTAKTKEVLQLTQQLKKHQEADKLLAAAAVVKKQADDAKQNLSQLNTQLATTKSNQASQRLRQEKATAGLKTAQAALPKKLEELTAARTTYDTFGKNVDQARLSVTQTRDIVKTKAAAVPPQITRLQKAKAALAQVNAGIDSLNKSLATLKTAAQTAGANPEEAGQELEKSIAGIKPLQKRATDLVSAIQAKVVDAEKQVTDANTVLKTAQDKLREHQTKYAAQSRTHFQLQLAVADLQNSSKLHENAIADSKVQQEHLTKEEQTLVAQIKTATEAVEIAEAAYIAKQKTAESELQKLNRFVSFSRQIAPIFARRCVACHNTRTAKGRLNMDSFATLIKGGESGEVLTAHDAENSLLTSMIEDGSMPKDADPLTKEEISLIRTWIEVGAPLDAGTLATAELFQVMPEIPQPLPPKTYRVPIPVTATAFNADATILASSGYHEILLWNTADGKLLRRITNVAERVYDLEFSKDGSQLVVAAGTPGQLGEVKLFATADGTHLKTLVRTKDAVFAIAFSPDGKYIAAGGADRMVYATDITSGKTVLKADDHTDWVMDVNWSPDGKQLVTASRDKTAKIINTATGRSVATFGQHGNAVYSAVFLTDGKSVVSAGSDRQARVWTAADGKEIRKIGGFGSDIFRIAVTPDNHLLTASADRNAREHNLTDGKSIRTFAGHKDWVYTLCYNPGKKLLATGSYDGEIRVWNSENGNVATSFIAVPQGADAATVAAAE